MSESNIVNQYRNTTIERARQRAQNAAVTTTGEINGYAHP